MEFDDYFVWNEQASKSLPQSVAEAPLGVGRVQEIILSFEPY